MRICYVNKGVSIHDQKMLKYLVQKHEVHLVSYYGGALPHIEGLIVHRIPIPNPVMAFPVACMMTPFLVRRIKPDIVLGNYLLTYGFYTALAHYHPLLQIAWGSDVFVAPNQNPLYHFIVEYSLKHADLVTIDCQTGKRALVALGYPAEKVVVFPWGIDQERFNPNIDGESVRRELGWEGNVIIICTRAHDPIYGMEYLIQAIPEVVLRHQEARFLLIGSGSLTGKLKQMVRDSNMEGHVKFTGNVPNDVLGKYLNASDFYVSASLSDGTSISLLEAMGCGLPVVVTDVEAILEWIQDGVNGLVVPKRDPLALAQRICQLIEDKTLRQSFGQRNYKIATERAFFDDNMNVLEDMCRLLAKSCHGGHRVK